MSSVRSNYNRSSMHFECTSRLSSRYESISQHYNDVIAANRLYRFSGKGVQRSSSVLRRILVLS
ncbi:hypothetical protein NC653_033130 [Populus alba x Populus x berolinensis]|uniref:Uncharacterized protein n=1 Tax=Populus alba x Populus x berolinensis TaxID=444605 RepID=A0AAD6PYR6_9ROSI|nr:hypothetical protein NC653_033130 [Populus alba x Populus x berolinensis]